MATTAAPLIVIIVDTLLQLRAEVLAVGDGLGYAVKIN